MPNEAIGNESVANQLAENQENTSGALRVYKKKSTFKGATENDFYYSATRSDGASVICKFKCDIETTSSAFEIYDIVGTAKQKQVEVKGEIYNNFTYYITSCKFREIQGEKLPF